MDAGLLSNLAAYSAQVIVIAAIGGLAATLLRIGPAPVRYAYWRTVLALCLVLPWLQGREDSGPGSVTAVLTFAPAGAAGQEISTTAASVFPWLAFATILLMAGMLVRFTWIGIGLAQLRRLRTAGAPAARCGDHDELQSALGTHAEIRYVTTLSQPLTFGAVRPVVLLPDTLRERSPHIQRAVLCHELFHVRRRDWLWMLGEEGVRAVLWFHPGIWWLVSNVQRAREEVVDELAVLATGQRRSYIEALLSFADDGRGPNARRQRALAPVAAFARRRHLFRRMVLVSKEAVMSSRRVVITCAAMALVVAGSSWYAVDMFPMAQAASMAQTPGDGPGPLERRAKAVTPENPVPRRTYSTTPIYPAEAAAERATAIVMLRVTLDESGRVAEVRSLQTTASARGAAAGALDRAAIDAVRQWQYDAPAEGPLSFNVIFGFKPDADPVLISQGGPTPAIAGAPAPPPPPPPPPPDWATGAVRVGGAIKLPVKTMNVAPIYPPLARASQVQGVVIIEARIEPDGRVGRTRVVRSIPLLDQAALDAVAQWEFTPTLLNGVPVAVIMTMTVNFSLSQ